MENGLKPNRDVKTGNQASRVDNRGDRTMAMGLNDPNLLLSSIQSTCNDVAAGSPTSCCLCRNYSDILYISRGLSADLCLSDFRNTTMSPCGSPFILSPWVGDNRFPVSSSCDGRDTPCSMSRTILKLPVSPPNIFLDGMQPCFGGLQRPRGADADNASHATFEPEDFILDYDGYAEETLPSISTEMVASSIGLPRTGPASLAHTVPETGCHTSLLQVTSCSIISRNASNISDMRLDSAMERMCSDWSSNPSLLLHGGSELEKCVCECHAVAVKYSVQDYLHRGFTSTVIACYRDGPDGDRQPTPGTFCVTSRRSEGKKGHVTDLLSGIRPNRSLDLFEPQIKLRTKLKVVSKLENGVRFLNNIRGFKEIVVKVIHKQNCDAQELDRCIQESKLLGSLRHQNIVRLLAYLEGSNEMWMFFERASYTDLAESTTGRDISEEDVKTIVRQLLQALKYCHNRHILHGDVKPKNILLYQKDGAKCTVATALAAPGSREFKGKWTDVRLKLADFGLAENLSTAEETFVRFNGVRGSHGYFAPEILLRRDYDFKVDIWAVGIIAYSLLVGYEPFYPPSVCISEEVQFNERYWSEKSPLAQHFCHQLLAFDPAARLTAQEALDHPWLRRSVLGDSAPPSSMMMSSLWSTPPPHIRHPCSGESPRGEENCCDDPTHSIGLCMDVIRSSS